MLTGTRLRRKAADLILLALLLVACASLKTSDAFTHNAAVLSQPSLAKRRQARYSTRLARKSDPFILPNPRSFQHCLHMTTIPGVLSFPARNVRALLSWCSVDGWVARAAGLLMALLVSTLIYRQGRNLLWPNVVADPNVPEPLPPGTLGCPWIGSNNLSGSKRLGPEFFYRKASDRLGNPRVWKSYFLGSPYAVISGSDLVQKVNNMEFSKTAPLSPSMASSYNGNNAEETKSFEESSGETKVKPAVFGRNNLMFERSREKHAFLRKLVGNAMTPQALKVALPTIQQTANDVIEREVVQRFNADNDSNDDDHHARSSNHHVKMENVCVDYTMDIVQRQLLGLNLPSKEVDMFREKLTIWTKAFFSILGQLNIPWLVTRSAPYKAKLYIESKLEQKIDSLLEKGPDSSTISNMFFAVDEDDVGSAKLSREEVIENALLLVLAGAETSAGSLTLAMLLLGLHPDKYSKLVQEQRETTQRHGEKLTLAIIDKECPYLDAVIKETLRMGPITGGFPRRALETIVVDGVQIPKKWPIFTSIRLTHQLDPVTRLPGDAHMDVYEGFQPERWFQPDTTPSEFLPFGAGPRYCLGYHLAMSEMKVFLAVLARRVGSFELTNYAGEAKKPVKWNPSTIMPRPIEGVLVKSIRRSS